MTEIKDEDGKIIDRVFNITEKGDKMLEELGYGTRKTKEKKKKTTSNRN